jgi:hypothetical protein
MRGCGFSRKVEGIMITGVPQVAQQSVMFTSTENNTSPRIHVKDQPHIIANTFAGRYLSCDHPPPAGSLFASAPVTEVVKNEETEGKAFRDACKAAGHKVRSARGQQQAHPTLRSFSVAHPGCTRFHRPLARHPLQGKFPEDVHNQLLSECCDITGVPVAVVVGETPAADGNSSKPHNTPLVIKLEVRQLFGCMWDGLQAAALCPRTLKHLLNCVACCVCVCNPCKQVNSKYLKGMLHERSKVVTKHHKDIAYKHERTAAGSGGPSFYSSGMTLKGFDTANIDPGCVLPLHWPRQAAATGPSHNRPLGA